MNELDKIFYEGLKNYEVEPSERANAKFEEALAKRDRKNKKPWAYFSMAAAMFLMFFTGFWFLNKENIKNGFTSEKTLSHISNSSPINVSNEVKNPHIEPKSMPIEKKIFKSNITMTTAIGFEKNKEEIIEKIDENEINELVIQNKNEVEKFAFEDKKSIDKPNYETIETLVFVSPLVSSPKIYNNIENLDRVISNNKQEDYFGEDKSLITRFFSELAGLKKGEKVDFNKLGFKSIEELSQDEESFIVSETKQIKKGYTWIKSKISNN